MPLKPKLNFSKHQLVVLAASLIIGGILFVVLSRAAGPGTITGVAFKDTNRNGQMDAGEEPLAGHALYLLSAEPAQVVGAASTDEQGRYSLVAAPGKYTISYSAVHASPLVSDEWVSTTTPLTPDSYTPSHVVELTGGDTRTANFGWRKLVKSTDILKPLDEKTFASGSVIRVYNDAITAEDVYSHLSQNSLIGQEQSVIKIHIGLSSTDTASSSFGSQDSDGEYIDTTTNAYISWASWMRNTSHSLYHEYGHGWSIYYQMVAQRGSLDGYLKARGLYGHPKLESEYKWSVGEIIADDYSILFGNAKSASKPHLNGDIPNPKDVPGLKAYLSEAFLNSPAGEARPPQPRGLAAELNGTGATVRWEAPADDTQVQQYYIYRNRTRVGSVGKDTTSFTDSSLDPNLSFTYYVRAKGLNSLFSFASNQVAVQTPPRDYQPPTSPTLSVSSSTRSSISLKWTASTDNIGVTGYKIWRRKDRRSAWTQIGQSTEPAYTNSGLAARTSYEYYVTAYDGSGNISQPSNVIKGTTSR